MSGTAAKLTIIQKLEQFGHTSLDDLEHGAVQLVGMAATAETSLNALEASSPLVAKAVQMGLDSAAAHGVPVSGIANAAQVVLDLAKQFAAGLAQPAPTS
jgi:hypothetical protein